MINMDAPKHTKLRKLVNKGFTPRMVRDLEASIHHATDELLDAVIEKGEADFVVDIGDTSRLWPASVATKHEGVRLTLLIRDLQGLARPAGEQQGPHAGEQGEVSTLLLDNAERAALRIEAGLATLEVPELEPVPLDHVLTKAFYLVDSFPGRYATGQTWVEALPPP